MSGATYSQPAQEETGRVPPQSHTWPATEFPYDAIEFDGVAASENSGVATKEDTLEILRRVGVFIRGQILAKGRDGKLPSATCIAVRLAVLQELIDPTAHRTLAEIARAFSCTRAYCCKVATQFSDSLGVRASWQRLAAREVYRQRALGVHRGNWCSTQKWELRKIREAKARAAAAAVTVAASVTTKPRRVTTTKKKKLSRIAVSKRRIR